MTKIVKYTDVLIVGAGPVGMILASWLAKNKVSFSIIDKRIETTNLPRAIAISHASLSNLCMLGLKDEAYAKGQLVDNINMYWKRRKLSDLNFKGLNLEVPKYFHLEQNVMENILDNNLKSMDIAVQRGHELISMRQDEKQVYAVVNEGKQEVEYVAKYVVGADGGASTIRNQAGIGVDVKNYGSYFTLADCYLEEGTPYEETQYYLTPEGYVMIVPLPEGKYRVILSHKGACPGMEALGMTQEVFQSWIDERVGKKITVKEMIWKAAADFRHHISEQGMKGRAILVGDAYHQFSPVGGTNMNVGMQDATCLAWALIKSVKANWKASLIEEYQKERDEVVDRQQKATESATYLLTQTHPEHFKGDEAAEFIKTIPLKLTGYQQEMGNGSYHYDLLGEFTGTKDSFTISESVNAALSQAKHVLLVSPDKEFFRETSDFMRQLEAEVGEDLRVYVAESFDLKGVFLIRPDKVVVCSSGLTSMYEDYRSVKQYFLEKKGLGLVEDDSLKVVASM